MVQVQVKLQRCAGTGQAIRGSGGAAWRRGTSGLAESIWLPRTIRETPLLMHGARYWLPSGCLGSCLASEPNPAG